MKPPPQPTSPAVVWAAPAGFVVLWASGFIGAKFGLPYAEPLTFLAIRMASVVLLLGVLIAVMRPAWPSGTAALHNMVAGILLHGCYLGGVFVSMYHGMPAGLAALIVGLQPVLTATLANRLLGERVLVHQWLGLVLGIVGVYLVVHERAVGEGDIVAWVSVTIALLGITIGTLYQKRFGGGVDWRTGFLFQYAAAGVLVAIFAFAFETGDVQWTGEFVFALAWLVLVLSFGAVWLLYDLIRRLGMARLVSLFYLTPPTTALMAWMFFDERLAPLALVGMAICVAGVAMVNWRSA